MNLYRRALDEATAVVRDVGAADLGRPTPCAGWDLRALLEHMIGQNHGFADALERAGRTDAPVEAFVPRALGDDGDGSAGDVGAVWETSVERVATAFTTVAAVAPGTAVLLAEVSTTQRIPVPTVLAMHLLDTVVHTWDVAAALGRSFRPDDELAGAVAEIAPMVPEGQSRELPGASFAPTVAVVPGADAWTVTLASLGRDAGSGRRRPS